MRAPQTLSQEGAAYVPPAQVAQHTPQTLADPPNLPLQAVDLLASVFSLYMGSRWLRNTAPSLRSAARAAKLQQGLALARLAAWSAAGPAPQLRLVLFSLEAAMILVTSWRLWSSASLVGTFGSAAQLFVTSCLLEVREPPPCALHPRRGLAC